jgi:hypothetical protein
VAGRERCGERRESPAIGAGEAGALGERIVDAREQGSCVEQVPVSVARVGDVRRGLEDERTERARY